MIWTSMVARCTNEDNAAFNNYGARGISVCARWRDFQMFLADMGEPPKGMTLDRVDNNKGYSPDNCRWVSRSAQSHNARITKLGWDQVREIRKLAGQKSKSALAKQFGISFIRHIILGKMWRAIWDEQPGFNNGVWGP